MATIKAHAHKNLASFLDAVITLAKAGDFIDGRKLARSHYGNRPYGSFPSVDLKTSKTAPVGSGKTATTGGSLYTAAFPQPFGTFLNDVQIAVATGGGQAGNDMSGLVLADYRLKPYFRCNVEFSAPATPKKTVEAKADITGKVGGNTVSFANLFTVSSAPAATAANFNFTVGGAGASTSGVSAAGLLTLADDATGDITVTATAKTPADFETGKNTATTTLKAVTAKP